MLAGVALAEPMSKGEPSRNPAINVIAIRAVHFINLILAEQPSSALLMFCAKSDRVVAKCDKPRRQYVIFTFF
jgi:hypothetical protein